MTRDNYNAVCLWTNCWIYCVFFDMGNMQSTVKFRMFGGVPDGTYEHAEHLVRYVIVDGNPVITLTKLWIDQGGPKDLDQYYTQPWGTFPSLPVKSKKI